jgi:hypothetical protein
MREIEIHIKCFVIQRFEGFFVGEKYILEIDAFEIKLE